MSADIGSIEHIFIVGAGFSNHAGLPLANGFTEALLDTSLLKEDGPSPAIVEFLNKFVSDTFGCSGNVAQNWPSLEDIFTCLDLSANTGHHLGTDYSPSILRTVRRGFIARILRMLHQKQNESERFGVASTSGLEKFFAALAPEKCAFLSMNWDSLIEKNLQDHHEIRKFDYGCGAFPSRFLKSGIKLSKEDDAKTALVLKPHGSVNWLYCDCCRQVLWFDPEKVISIAQQIFKTSDWEIAGRHLGQPLKHKGGKHSCPLCGAPSLGTRLATFSYRKALGFPMIDSTWRTAETILRKAKTWTFIGYSMPAADYEFKHMLKHVQLSRPDAPSISVVTGGEPDMAKRTVDNYRRFFGPQIENQYENGLDDNAISGLIHSGILENRDEQTLGDILGAAFENAKKEKTLSEVLSN